MPSMMTTSTTALAPAPATKVVALVYSTWFWYGRSATVIMVAPEWPKFWTCTDDPKRFCMTDG